MVAEKSVLKNLMIQSKEGQKNGQIQEEIAGDGWFSIHDKTSRHQSAYQI